MSLYFYSVQLDEVFHLNLYGGGAADQMGVVGPKSSIQITVTQNDDPHGVLGFTAARVVRRIGTLRVTCHNNVSRESGLLR